MDTQSAIVETLSGPQKRLRFAVAATLVQAVAAVFFVADTLVDAQLLPAHEPPALSWIEFAIAVALLAGTAMGALLTRRLVIEARERERVIAVARGALAEVIAERFSSWRLSRAESDVALFALKGFTIAEIASLRGSAEGTVRAQLSQIYAKAGVSSQASLMALFFEELL